MTGKWAVHKADMSALPGNTACHGGTDPDAAYHVDRHDRVIRTVQEQCGHPDPGEQRCGGAFCPKLPRCRKTVHRGGKVLIEIIQALSGEYTGPMHEIRITCPVAANARFHVFQKIAPVKMNGALLQMGRRCRQVNGRTNRGRTAQDFEGRVTSLPQIFEQSIPAERDADGIARTFWHQRRRALQHPTDFRAVSGVITAG